MIALVQLAKVKINNLDTTVGWYVEKRRKLFPLSEVAYYAASAGNVYQRAQAIVTQLPTGFCSALLRSRDRSATGDQRIRRRCPRRGNGD